jgi:hypothetical protein
MNFGNVARVVTVAAACFAALGSATSNTNNGPAASQQYAKDSPPPPQQMDAGRALGLWRSTFGAVKITSDDLHGGIQAGAVQGIWEYQRQGQDVIGYFYGTLRGNVLQFRWNEPNNPPLNGEGFLVFEPSGRQYSGRWWTDKRDRIGDWNGTRAGGDASQQQYANYGQPYGGAQYGSPQAQPQGYPQQTSPQGYPQQGYPQQGYPQQGYPQQQYPQQGYPQQPPPQQYPPQQYPPQQYPPQQYPQQQYPQQQYPQQPAPQPQQSPYPQGQRT